jgi:hypothetical protein
MVKYLRMLSEMAGAGCYNMKDFITSLLLLAIVAICLFEYVLNRQCAIFREFEATFLSFQWMLLVCLTIWCGFFVFLTFSVNDLPLIGMLLIAIAVFVIGYTASSQSIDLLIVLAGVTFGKVGRLFLDPNRGSRIEGVESSCKNISCELKSQICLMGLIMLLAIASSWHLDNYDGSYHGPRWTGFLNNPNDYGLLMATGLILAIGLLLQKLKFEKLKAEMGEQKAEDGGRKEGQGEDGSWKMEDGDKVRSSEFGVWSWLRFFAVIKSAIVNWQSSILLVAALMMGLGLVMSYSRGAWCGTAVGLLYLAKAYGKFKWRYMVIGAGLVALGMLPFWGTPDSASWYLKRLDLSRGSVQHRVAAWKAGLEIMRDHPFGVGWNKVVPIYQDHYSPPEDGAAAISTNDYLMLGTQLGIPGLMCFVAYAALCLGVGKMRKSARGDACPTGGGQETTRSGLDETQGSLETGDKNVSGVTPETATGTVALPAVASPVMSPVTRHLSPDALLCVACRAGALAMLVAFWFDGGLFKLATASVFWILLELGAETRFKPRINTDEHRLGDAEEQKNNKAESGNGSGARSQERVTRKLFCPVCTTLLWSRSFFRRTICRARFLDRGLANRG